MTEILCRWLNSELKISQPVGKKKFYLSQKCQNQIQKLAIARHDGMEFLWYVCVSVCVTMDSCVWKRFIQSISDTDTLTAMTLLRLNCDDTDDVAIVRSVYTCRMGMIDGCPIMFLLIIIFTSIITFLDQKLQKDVHQNWFNIQFINFILSSSLWT